MSTTGATPASHRWHHRLEARVAGALGLIVAAALGAVLVITIETVSTQSHVRAAEELEIARTAFSNHLRTRTASAIAESRLISELPVFRAHFTDTRLAEDHQTIHAMADGYREQLNAQFIVVTNAAGTWLASPGWGEDRTVSAATDKLTPIVEHARRRESIASLVEQRDELFLAVSTPALFADELLGTLTIGYRITDELATELARIARCEVVVLAGSHVAATSLRGDDRALAGLSSDTARMVLGVHDELYEIGGRRFVSGTFGLDAGTAPIDDARLVLLADWQPTQTFVNRLGQRFLVGGLAAFGLALAAGLVFSRNVSRPLRDIATASAKIADGDLALRLPVRGTAEAMTVAHAFNDMSRRLAATRDRLEHDAIHDGLTQLPNRVLLMERLERAMARRAHHPAYRVAVLFLDIDRFKRVNDSLGHDAGDRLLIEMAERLTGAVRSRDLVVRERESEGLSVDPNTLARFGGDEFVILLDDIHDPVDAVRVAERIQKVAGQPITLDDEELFTSLSIGIVVSAPMHQTGGDLVRDADLAMYRAKGSGGGSYVLYDETMHEAAIDRLRLETELRRAVERQEFFLSYQPIVSLSDGSVRGYESLIRWMHPDRGPLPPSEFLEAAEQIGVMPSIDQWALREACRQCRQWHMESRERRNLYVSVNLSARAFGSTHLVSRVANVLADTGLPPHGLRIEVTEGAAMADPAHARTTIEQLRELGVRVSLDDFGTGYCSLSYLQQFRADVLKIDRSFVARIGESGSATDIVRLIVSLAKTLDLEVVAEGTETRAQIALLQALGCDYGQGYFYSRPLPPEEISLTGRTESPREVFPR